MLFCWIRTFSSWSSFPVLGRVVNLGSGKFRKNKNLTEKNFWFWGLQLLLCVHVTKNLPFAAQKWTRTTFFCEKEGHHASEIDSHNRVSTQCCFGATTLIGKNIYSPKASMTVGRPIRTNRLHRKPSISETDRMKNKSQYIAFLISISSWRSCSSSAIRKLSTMILPQNKEALKPSHFLVGHTKHNHTCGSKEPGGACLLAPKIFFSKSCSFQAI